MVLPSKWRGVLYIVAAIASAAIGTAVALGVVTTDEVDRWVAAAVYAVTTIASIIARLNLTPPEGTDKLPEKQ